MVDVWTGGVGSSRAPCMHYARCVCICACCAPYCGCCVACALVCQCVPRLCTYTRRVDDRRRGYMDVVDVVAGLWVFMRARRLCVRRAVAVIRLRYLECVVRAASVHTYLLRRVSAFIGAGACPCVMNDIGAWVSESVLWCWVCAAADRNVQRGGICNGKQLKHVKPAQTSRATDQSALV